MFLSFYVVEILVFFIFVSWVKRSYYWVFLVLFCEFEESCFVRKVLDGIEFCFEM